jgi:chromosome segregation ATPase
MSDIFGEDVELPQDPIEPVPEEVKAEETVEVEEPVVKPMVSIDALHQARREAQEAKAEIQRLKPQLEQVQTLKQQLEEWRSQEVRQTEEQQFNADPLGAIRNDIQSLKQQQEAAQQETAQERQSTEQAQQFQSAVQNQVAAFTQEHEDYPQALQHVLDARAEEMRLIGVPESQIPEALNAESIQLAQNAIQSGRNPAEIIYNLANMRGFSAKAKPQPSLDNIEKGQQAAGSLANTQGEAEGVGLMDIEKMSDAEFDAFWEKEMNPPAH